MSKGKKIPKKRIVLFAVLGLVVALIGYGIYAASKIRPIIMPTAVTEQPLTSYLSISGKITNGDLDEYILSGGSTVEAVYCEVGDTVNAGDLLVKFDNTTVRDSYKKAAIAYEKVRLQLDETENKFFDVKEDIRELEEDMVFYKEQMEKYEDYPYDPLNPSMNVEYNKYVSYEAKYESAKTKKETLEKSIPSDEALKISQLGYEEAKMAMDAAERTLADAPADIYAERDGVVESLTVSKYRDATKGQVAVSVRTTTTTTADFKVGRYDIARLRVGQAAIATVGGVDYSGVVSQIDSVATADSYINAKIRLDSTEGIIPGLECDIEIIIYHTDSALTLPLEAVKTDRNGDYCYVMEPIPGSSEGYYKPVKTYITTGNSSMFSIEVLGGVTTEQVIALSAPTGIDMMTECIVLPMPE